MTDASLCNPRYLNDLTAEKVRDLLNYDPETWNFHLESGSITPVRMRVMLLAQSTATATSTSGISGTRYKASRLAWLWVTGEWPRAEIDHVNRDHRTTTVGSISEKQHAHKIAINSPR